MGRASAADLDTLPQARAFEALKRARNDQEKVEAITAGRLPHEVSTCFAGSSAMVWHAIVPNLPVFALVRHQGALQRHGVLDTHRWHVERTLSDRRVILGSRVLPFRFLEASRHVKGGWVKDALRQARELSFTSVPDVGGRTAVLLDRLGSMARFIDVAAIFAICRMKKARNNGRFMLFDGRLEEVSVSMVDSVLTQAERVKARGGTNHALALEALTHDRDKVGGGPARASSGAPGSRRGPCRRATPSTAFLPRRPGRVASRHPLQERVPVSMVSVRSAIAKALETPQGRPAVSKAEASTITRAG